MTTTTTLLLRLRNLIILSSIPTLSGLTQPNQYGFNQLQHESIAIESAEVIDMLQDRFGFMWLATTDGLICYDGHEMEIYRENPLDSTSLGDNFTRQLIEDQHGDLWIGTGQGDLFRYNRRQDNFTYILEDPDAKVASEVRDLLLDSQNRLWVATNFGLELVDQQKLTRKQYFKNGHPLHDYLVNSLLEDQQGRIWMATGGKGLHLLDPSTGKSRKVEKELSFGAEKKRETFYDLLLTTDGKIWLTDGTHILRCIDPIQKTGASYSLTKAGYAYPQIWQIEAADGDALWLGTRYQGLIHFVPSSQDLTIYTHDPVKKGSLASNMIFAILKKPGVLWVGHPGNGVSQLHLGDAGMEQIPIQVATQEATSFSRVVKDHRGHIWAATQGNGLYRLDPDTGLTTHFLNEPGKPNSLAHNLVWDLLVDRQGLLWIATHGGLQSFDPEKEQFTAYDSDSGLPHPAIRSLLQDQEGTLWVGAFAGLYRLAPGSGRLQFVELYTEHSSFIVIDLYEDSREYLWVSVFGIGAYRIDLKTGKSTHFQNDPTDLRSLSGNIVVAFAEDDQQNVWLGTQGGGLNLFIPQPATRDSGYFQHWRPYNSELPQENIWDIYPDDDQRLWLNTSAGLFTFNTQNQKLTSYQLPGISKRFSIDSRSADPGKLFLRDQDRVYWFIPDSLAGNEQIPPVFVTGLQINGQEVFPKDHFDADDAHLSVLDQTILFTESIDLPYWQNDLTFQFSALNFIQPEKNQYRFKLEGYDSEWTGTDAANRRIRYTNLPPGQFTFKVLGANNDGLWNETGKTLAINIAPPWWHTWWAYLIYAALFFLSVRTIYKFQLNRKLIEHEAIRLKELDAAKTRLYTNITHEFRTPLTIILGMALQIKDDPKRWYNEGLQMITRNGRQLLGLVNQMLDLSKLDKGKLKLKMQQGEVVGFIQYLVQSFESFAAGKNIRLHFLKEIGRLEMDFDPDQLTKVVSNLLSNAVKYTPEGGQVYVRLRSIPGIQAETLEALELRVKDTGPGIAPEELSRIFDRFYQTDSSATREAGGTGIGLALAKEFVQLMGGEIRVQSKIGEGSDFSVLLPVSRSAPKTATAMERAGPDDLIGDAHITEVATTGGVPLSTGNRKESLGTASQNGDLPLVLLIEDNRDVLTYVASCLEANYQLEFATNGREGIDQALEIVPDIIISDVIMPEKDGYEVCAVLKEDFRTSHIPIILLTAKADQDAKLEGLKAGADAYLAKPFDQKELDIRLEKLLDLRRRLQARYSNLQATTQSETQSLSKEELFLKDLREAVEENLSDESFGVVQLSRKIGLSRSQLHNKLKALTGQSASLYMRAIRLEKAKELLRNTDLNISEIAYEVGFRTPLYFTQVFSKEVGVAPSVFRMKE